MSNSENDGGVRRSILDRFPIAIDPASQFLSIRQTDEEQSPPVRQWSHLRRVMPARAHIAIPTSNTRVHFFADGESFESSRIILSYDAIGSISGIWHLVGNRWDECALPEEWTGQPVSVPSVRFMFNSTEDRAEFIKNFNQLASDAAASRKISNKHVLALLRASSRSPLPYRVVHAIAQPDTTEVSN